MLTGLSQRYRLFKGSLLLDVGLLPRAERGAVTRFFALFLFLGKVEARTTKKRAKRLHGGEKVRSLAQSLVS